MIGTYHPVWNLRFATQRQVGFLTLITFVCLFATFSHADQNQVDDSVLVKQRVHEATSYLRAQGMQGLSILPSEVKEVSSWFSGTFHPLRSLDDDTAETSNADAVTQAMAATPAAQSARLFDLEGNMHHKGFLPTHDSFVMGPKFNQSLLGSKMGLSFKPYYGQNYFSMRGYYGGEIAMDIAKRTDDGLPWGKIALGYVGGDDNLTDDGHGMEVRGDVDLTNHFKFTTGLRQSVDGASNYAMVKWALKFGNNP